MQLAILFKGKTELFDIEEDADISELHEAASSRFCLVDVTIKLIQRGKTLPTMGAVATHAKPGAKLMLVASARGAMADEPRADPTVRGFEQEDALATARCHEVAAVEVSEWGDTGARTGEWRFCRLELCSWQSFGTRPSSSTPHAFEARKLLLKLSTDPAIVAILRQREWVVGTLGEMDPVDDRLAHKTHEQGKCLLGYNTNHGARIDVRLRTHDLRGFLPYPQLIETLLHEMAHNVVGPHDEHFWHLFAQLKADYLRIHRDLAASGTLFLGRSPLAVSGVADQVVDVRSSVLVALEQDRQEGPPSQMQISLLDGYLAATDSGGGGRTLAATGGGPTSSGGGGGCTAGTEASREEMRALLAERAAARQGGGASDSSSADVTAPEPKGGGSA